MRRRLIITNIILLLIALVMCIGISLYASRRNVASNARKSLLRYVNAIKLDLNSGETYDSIIEKYSSIEPDMRITFIRYFKNQDSMRLMTDNYFDNEALAEVDWASLPEIEKAKIELDEADYILRSDDKDSQLMIYYTAIIPSGTYDSYIRVGLIYENLFDDNTSFLLFSIAISAVIFVIMALVMSQSIIVSMKPLNKVIGNLEELATTEKKEYNFSSFEDILAKIADVQNELSKNMQSIKAEKNKVELILENMGQGLIALNEDFSINLINKEALNILFNDDVTGLNFMDVVKDELLKEKVKMALDEQSHIIYELKVEDLYYSLSINSTQNIWGDGESKRIIIVITDVTDEKLIDIRQKEFFSNASHELRSPLTSIIGFQELICEDFVGAEEVKGLCEKTLQEGKRMQTLLNDMLDLSALEKEEKGEVTKINLRELIDDITSSLEPQLFLNEITIIKNTDDSFLIANKKHIYQLVRNLIDNAIKYNKKQGKIFVNVYTSDYVVIEVKDTGVGIASKDQSQIFERFYRVDKARSRKMGSSGLGLAIVRQVCNIYQATVSIESKLKEGTKITIKFPKIN